MDREQLRDTDTLRASSLFGGDGAAAAASSFAELSSAFNARITELQQAMCLRIEENAKHLFVADLRGLDASVHALEKAARAVREHVAREAAAVPKARALIAAAQAQQARLQLIAGNLPQHLPGRGAAGAAGSGAAVAAAAAAGGGRFGANKAATSDGAAAAVAAAGGGGGGVVAAAGAGGPSAPRWYVTAKELESVAPYMRGRLTLDKVNAALDEAAQHAEQTLRWMAALRAHAHARVPAAERARAVDLYHGVANREGVRGTAWFTEADLRGGAALKPDKTGKSLLMLLRHLGRISEVRVNNVEALGGTVIVYVLARPPQ